MADAGDSATREATPGRDWTKGNILHNVLSLSWPMVVTESLWVVGMTVDMIWVGRLGLASIAGVGVAGILVMFLMAARWGLSVGTRAMISRFVGAGDTEGANHVAKQAFFISGAYSVFMVLVGLFLAEPILSLMGMEADVITEGAAYMRIVFVGSISMSYLMMAEGIMQASGDVMTPMKITIFSRLFHIVLDPFLILGWWIFPHMGVSGAATANLISQSLGMALALWVLFTGRSRLRLNLSNFRIDWNMIWRIVKIGIPSSIMGVQGTIGNLALMWFMSPFGTVAIAAHTLNGRIQQLLFMPSMAFGMAAGVLVGQNLGAKQPGRAEKSGWLAVGLAEGIMVTCSVAIFLWAEKIVPIFNPDPGLVEITSTFLRIAAVGYLVLGFMVVLQFCISGAGDTLPPMLISVIIVWVIQLPLAFLLSRTTDLGMNGIRWAIVAGMIVGTVAYITYYRMGRWKRKKV